MSRNGRLASVVILLIVPKNGSVLAFPEIVASCYELYVRTVRIIRTWCIPVNTYPILVYIPVNTYPIILRLESLYLVCRLHLCQLYTYVLLIALLAFPEKVTSSHAPTVRTYVPGIYLPVNYYPIIFFVLRAIFNKSPALTCVSFMYWLVSISVARGISVNRYEPLFLQTHANYSRS